MAPPLLASRALVLQGAAVLPVLVGCRVRSSVGARAAARTGVGCGPRKDAGP